VQLAETKRDLALATQELSKAMRSTNYDIQAEMDAEANIESLKAGIAKATKVLKERF
jgi:hypothetical protein